ncbi:MAG: hypothetical protein H0T97_00345 [Actinobacteria bacterium]|nr:hypothetical protein [Actinomycetota bacterium]
MATTTAAPAPVVFEEGQYEFLEGLASWLVNEVDVLRLQLEGARRSWIDDGRDTPRPISLQEVGRLGVFDSRLRSSMAHVSSDLRELMPVALEIIDYSEEGEPFADGGATRLRFAERLEALAGHHRSSAGLMVELAADREKEARPQ